MKTGKKRGKLLAKSLVLTVLASLALAPAAAATQGFQPADKGRLIIVEEPDTMSTYVEFYKGEDEHPKSELTWVEGRTPGSKAVQLDGVNEYLRLWHNQLKFSQMTYSGWFYWKGAAEGQPDEAKYGQRLFTMSRRVDNYLTFSPWMRDAGKKDEQGRILDGLYLNFSMGKGRDFLLEKWNPAVDGEENYSIPMNEWHHVALTADGQRMKLYIDGRLWFDEAFVKTMAEMAALQFTVGGTIWDTPTFNGLVDDTYLYNFALSEDQVRIAAGGGDPMDTQATVPGPSQPYIPTEPTQPGPTAPSGGASVPGESDNYSFFLGTIFGLPKLTVYLVGGLLILFIILCVVVNIYYIRKRNRKGGGGR